MRNLYSPLDAYNQGFLQVSPLHAIYYEESGNPHGIPVIVLHGGPGSKSKPKYRQFFHPEKYRIILFDQRGCGKSIPLGEIKENTTWDLVEDIEKLRNHLGIRAWIVFGGSWGSTLALAYAETHPEAVRALIVRGIWLCRNQDIDWLLKGKELQKVFPDLWKKRCEYLKRLNIDVENPLERLYDKVMHGSVEEQKLVSVIFMNFEGQFMSVNQTPQLATEDDVTEEIVNEHKILLHYAKNQCFLKENQLIKNADKLPNVPTVIIHGRYDMICPFENAWELKNALPNAYFELIPDAGHYSSEPGTVDKLIEWTDRLSTEAAIKEEQQSQLKNK